jgi:hypothetical protein
MITGTTTVRKRGQTWSQLAGGNRSLANKWARLNRTNTPRYGATYNTPNPYGQGAGLNYQTPGQMLQQQQGSWGIGANRLGSTHGQVTGSVPAQNTTQAFGGSVTNSQNVRAARYDWGDPSRRSIRNIYLPQDLAWQGHGINSYYEPVAPANLSTSGYGQTSLHKEIQYQNKMATDLYTTWLYNMQNALDLSTDDGGGGWGGGGGGGVGVDLYNPNLPLTNWRI